MSKVLVVADDGLNREIKWDYKSLNYSPIKLSFLEDQSGKGTCLEVEPRVFRAREVAPSWFITDLLPINGVEWAIKNHGPFELAVIGPNRGLNLGDKSYFSSSSMAMGKILAHYGTKVIVVSMDTKKEKFSHVGSRRLCHMVNQLATRVESPYLLSLNFVCSDPALARGYVFKTLPEEQNTLFNPQYIKRDNEWFYNIKGRRVKGYKKGTVVFTLIPRY